MVSESSWKRLNELSEKQLYKLADLMSVVFLNEPEGKEELVLILSTEAESKIRKALKQISKHSSKR